MAIRKPAYAGVFYPANPLQLRKTIEEYIVPSSEKQKVIGIVSPHAGYVYSGKVAGAVYSQIKNCSVFIILGLNHHGRGKKSSIITEGEWITPYGGIKINSSLAGKILSRSNFLEENERIHLDEHSLEVQVPFIQHLNPSAQIVPICMQEYSDDICRNIGNAIADSITEENVVIVASSDMTHYEPVEIAQQKDKLAIEKILNVDPEGLLKIVIKENISMCGVGPVATMIYAGKKLTAKEGRLISYQTSGDVTGDYHSVVGYAGIIIK
ncbi:AmmeMemoRadiSam system protein B [bacterium]|nr:AmmeMemoRadiSam system protein B [bacterium]